MTSATSGLWSDRMAPTNLPAVRVSAQRPAPDGHTGGGVHVVDVPVARTGLRSYWFALLYLRLVRDWATSSASADAGGAHHHPGAVQRVPLMGVEVAQVEHRHVRAGLVRAGEPEQLLRLGLPGHVGRAPAPRRQVDRHGQELRAGAAVPQLPGRRRTVRGRGSSGRRRRPRCTSPCGRGRSARCASSPAGPGRSRCARPRTHRAGPPGRRPTRGPLTGPTQSLASCRARTSGFHRLISASIGTRRCAQEATVVPPSLAPAAGWCITLYVMTRTFCAGRAPPPEHGSRGRRGHGAVVGAHPEVVRVALGQAVGAEPVRLAGDGVAAHAGGHGLVGGLGDDIPASRPSFPGQGEPGAGGAGRTRRGRDCPAARSRL